MSQAMAGETENMFVLEKSVEKHA
jgi:hypothetical protein